MMLQYFLKNFIKNLPYQNFKLRRKNKIRQKQNQKKTNKTDKKCYRLEKNEKKVQCKLAVLYKLKKHKTFNLRYK